MPKTMQLTQDMLRVGYITSTHGVHGEVKVFPTTEDVKRFLDLKKVYLHFAPRGMINTENKECFEYNIAGVKFFKQYAILKLEGIDDMDVAAKWKGAELYVTREDAIPLEEGEYYIADLIGLAVIDADNGERIGTLTDVMQTGANDVYVIQGAERYQNKEILAPVIDDCVKDIDLSKGTVSIHLMEGLLDL